MLILTKNGTLVLLPNLRGENFRLKHTYAMTLPKMTRSNNNGLEMSLKLLVYAHTKGSLPTSCAIAVKVLNSSILFLIKLYLG